MSVARILIVTALALGAFATPASAGIWTPIDSGTTANITAVDYQGGDRFWLATADGSIRYREAGVFKPAAGTGLPTGLVFNDIAFNPASNIGLAVGNGGNVWRSTDLGRTWTKLTPLTVAQNCFSPSGGPLPTVPLGDMFSIAWGSDGVVYIGGANDSVLRSTNSGGSFTEVNKVPNACRINDSISDMFFFPSRTSRNDEKLYFQAREAFGKMYFTADGLLSAATPRNESINGVEVNTNLAVDPTNTNRIWATNQCGFTCFYRSEDGAATFACICSLQNENSENQVAWFDVEYAGGTVLTAGRSGQIATSIDGVNFFYNKADGALATKDWFAAALASGTAAAVGGQGGALVVTGSANVIPDIVKPTGVIAGPSTGRAGQGLTFTAQVSDNSGGSGIDPAGFSWTSAGLPGATGSSATLVFPNPGSYSVRLSFRAPGSA